MRTRKRVLGDLKEAEAEENSSAAAVEVGTYVTLHLKEVARHLFNCWKELGKRPLVAFSMLPHEQKMSVLNFAVKRHPGAMDDVIKSKERLIFHIGYRRFAACPIFSQHTNGNYVIIPLEIPNFKKIMQKIAATLKLPENLSFLGKF